jgi:protein O-GlcNAc transferase
MDTTHQPLSVSQANRIGFEYFQAGRLAEAEAIFLQIATVDPANVPALEMLGCIADHAGKHQQALEFFNLAIQQNPADPFLHFNLGVSLHDQGRLKDALACYCRVISLKPDHAKSHNRLGVVLQQLGKPDEALPCYRTALALTPGDAEIHNNLGAALYKLGRTNEAQACYRKALEINPNYANAHNNLGVALQKLGSLDEALDCYRKALELDPKYAEGYNNQGTALQELKRYGEAQRSYEKAIALKPDYAEAYCNLSTLLYRIGLSDNAAAALDKCLRIDPRHAKAQLYRLLNNLPIVPADSAEAERGMAKFDSQFRGWAAWVSRPEMRDAAAKVVGDRQPFYLAYRPGNQRERLSLFGDVTAALMAGHCSTSPTPRTPGSIRRVRLAIVSAHVRQHSVWDVVLHGLLVHLDRNHFETILIPTANKEDSVTMQAKTLVTRYHGGCSDLERCLQIVARETPDIIFYPEIGMDTLTNKLANLRLAPLQIASWGHPITSGLPTIDLFLSGERLEGPHADSHYREKLIRLPGTGACTLTPSVNPEPLSSELRGLLGDSEGPRFVLCQNALKFDPAYDDLYPQIASRMGRCRFYLLISELDGKPLSDRLIERLKNAFTTQGLDPSHYLELVDWLPTGQFYSLLDEMDAYLDCPGFSAYTTAWHAVHRGVPIVTLEGEFMRQRLAAGVLRKIGQTDTIASSLDEYVETAVRVALESRDAVKRAARRTAIREAAALLDDDVAVVRAFEQILIDELAERGYIIEPNPPGTSPISRPGLAVN